MTWLWLALIGAFGGICSGLFGVGGGLIFVPLLVFLLHFDVHLAIGTSLAVILPTAFSGLTRFAASGHVNWKAALMVAAFAIIGAWIGAGLSLKLSSLLLRRLFAVFLALVAIKMFFRN
ncbi:MAG TPA: sulfite exporter TauE/SafE family protein [Verrucomicrobiae bacterium]|jgi:uncharacterized membrane protein YfcA|nr:sulfite exporter TauE/SafE family protein [Verrucomicrobiae bacterium]